MIIRKSDRLWKQYLRLSKMQNNYERYSEEWFQINKYLWKVIGKYCELLIKENK